MKKRRIILLVGVLCLLAGCGKGKKKDKAAEDAVEMSVAIPLTPEQATALSAYPKTSVHRSVMRAQAR